MFVQAGLFHRKGIGSFDPVSDGWLIFNGDPDNSWYYTWRGHREPIPQSCTIAGVFLGDHYGNFVFEGTRNFGSLGYVNSLFPKLQEGYKHSEFHRIFEAPATVEELVYKVSQINELYFGAEEEHEATPIWYGGVGFSWTFDREKGISGIRCSNDVDHAELSEQFYEMVQRVDPRHHIDPRLMDKRVLMAGRRDPR